MALFSSNDASNLGSINLRVQNLFTLPNLPNIIAEWSALIPLVCHLASYRQNHLLAGEIALNGRVSVGLCPRLGVLAGIASLLHRGPDFLDQVSAKGGEGKRVWDVNWGCVFPCANGAASTFLSKYALGKKHHVIKMPETVIPKDLSSSTITSASDEGIAAIASDGEQSRSCNGSAQQHPGVALTEGSMPKATSDKNAPISPRDPTCAVKKSTSTAAPVTTTNFRRYQRLHVLDFSFTSQKPSWRTKAGAFFSSAIFEAATFVMLIGLVILLCMFGSYGTASVLLCGAVSQLICRLLTVQHPQGYLGNNETHDACMLVGIHQNASVWYLYIGNRGAVDWILNKTMISFPPRGKILARWFKFAHLLQLFGMTFAGAQKGWDGVCLLVLITVDSVFRWRFSPVHVAEKWLEAEKLTVHAKTFDFTGRTPMLAAIQQWNAGKNSLWMDELLPHCSRRDILLKSLCPDSVEADVDSLSDFDRKWVEMNLSLASQATEVLKFEIEDMRNERAAC